MMSALHRGVRTILLVMAVLLVLVVGGGVYVWQVQRDARQKVAAIRDSLQDPAPPTADVAIRADGTSAEPSVPPSLAPFAQQACTNASDLARTLGPLAAFADSAAPATSLVKSSSGLGARAAAMVEIGSAAGETVAGLNVACEAL